MKFLYINNDTLDVTIDNTECLSDVIKRVRYSTSNIFMKEPTGNEAKVIINIIKLNLVKGIVYNITDENAYNRQMLLTNNIAMQLTNIISEQFILDTKEFRQTLRALLEISLRIKYGVDHPIDLLMNGKYVDSRLSLNVIDFKHLYVKHNNLNALFNT